MKFLYFGDLHERATTPEHRKDDFMAAVDRKREEIRMLGEKHNVKAFLQPGDFLDKPKMDSEFLSELVKKWGFSDLQQQAFDVATGLKDASSIQSKLVGYKPIVGAIGNHELYGNSLKSYPRTSLAFLEEIGFMHIPKDEKPIIFNDPSGFSVAITAGHYDTKMDDESMRDVYIVEKKLADFHIHMVHGYLTNKDMGNMFPHTTVDDIAKDTQADLTIAGHDHIGFKQIEVDGKWFVNTGGITRLTNDKKEIRRRPKVMLVSIDKEEGITLKNIYLKSAEKGEDVLDRSHTVFQKSMSDKMEEIKSLVNKSQVGAGLSIADIIQSISEAKQLDDDLKDRAIEAVTKKMDAIQKGTFVADDYYISKIILENFQSHEYNEFELNSGLNVFVGKSSAGKSAIQRSLAWVYENEGTDPRRFIQVGKDFTRVQIHLSTGVIISRLVEKKKTGKNGYEIFDPKTGETTYYNTKGLPIVQEILGFSGLQIDDRKSIPLNFQKQGMSWFFIGDSFTNSDRAKIIGAVYQTHYVDAVIKDLESSTKKTKILMKEKQKHIDSTVKEMEKYDHLPQLNKTIATVSERLEDLSDLEEKKEQIKAIVSEMKAIDENIRVEKETVERYKHLSLVESRLFQMEGNARKLVQAKEIKREMDEIQRNLHTQKKTLHNYKHLVESENRYQTLQQNLKTFLAYKEAFKKAQVLEQEKASYVKAIKESKAIVQAYSNLTKAEAHLKTVETHMTQLKQAKPVLENVKEIIKSGKVERLKVKQLKDTNKDLVSQYQTLLKRVGTCPTCQSQIDARIITNISMSYQMEREKEQV